MAFKPQYTLNQCLHKHIYTLLAFAKKEYTVEIGKKEYKIGGKEVKISPNFLRSIKCQRCGNCCRRYFNIWSAFKGLECLNLKQTKITIDNKKTKLYYTEPDYTTENCKYCFFKYNVAVCDIYHFRPILSRMPHMFIDDKKTHYLLTKRQFGRNWALGCKSVIEDFDLEGFKEDIDTLELIKYVLEEMKIKHKLDKIIFELWRKTKCHL